MSLIRITNILKIHLKKTTLEIDLGGGGGARCFDDQVKGLSRHYEFGCHAYYKKKNTG